MKTNNQPTIKVFTLLVFSLAFISAWQFWTSLLDGQVMDSDLIAPIAYGFGALAGAIALLILSRSSQRTGLVRGLFIIGALILLATPFIFFFLRSPLLQTIAQIKYWVICFALLGGMIYLVILDRLTSPQKAGLLFSILMGIISPVMPWAGLFIFFPTQPLGNFTWAFAQYGLWLTAAVWAGTAWLMVREHLQPVLQRMVMIFLLGLAIFLVGIYNPVQFSSQTYLQSTYMGGALVSRGFVDIANLNYTLLAGMGLILLSLMGMSLAE